jgi:hypothetical protein
VGSAGCRAAGDKEPEPPVVGRAVLAVARRADLLLPEELVAAAAREAEVRRRSQAGRR